MILIILLLLNFSHSDTTLQNNNVFFYDSFENLDNWKSFQFSSGKKPTEFEIIAEEESNYLQIKSDSSSSGLICNSKYNPNEYPLLKWKWKVNNIIPYADGKTKAGDDYAIRIFVMFEKDSSEISFWEKIEKSTVKLISGYDLPYKSLCYVWANSEENDTPYFSPYSDDVLIIPLQSGSENCNQWIEESIDVAKDFKKYLKEETPSIACIAISGDTDNTKKKTIANLEYIRINSNN